MNQTALMKLSSNIGMDNKAAIFRGSVVQCLPESKVEGFQISKAVVNGDFSQNILKSGI
jgi:hypothetical protein